MSRGLGTLQQRICAALELAPRRQLPLGSIRELLPQTDRSNFHRALRSLQKRGRIELFDAEPLAPELGERPVRYVRLLSKVEYLSPEEATKLLTELRSSAGGW